MATVLPVAAPAAAQSATATATADAKALVLRRLSFIKVQDMHLGDIIPSTTSAGTVRLYPNGTRTATGGIVLVGNTHQPARFAGAGTNGRQVAISLSSNTIWLTGPGTQMRLRNFEIGSTPTAILSTTPTLFRINSPTGSFNFPVGGTLEVARNQAPGEYTGTFTITLNYL